jgi:lipopolysaccharide transport system ATP-binding protein
MAEPIIRVENLGKKYLIKHREGGQKYRALRDVIAGAGKSALGLFRRRDLPQNNTEEFWALKDVSFDIQEGEVVGIIGRNGAGKSTLLKILSRITEPTTGRVTLNGRVASLLEVGTGFHPELTGRENVYLNGAILGMARAEIARKFDEIVAFAEVEKFLDTPVKRYSSGMYVRLAFAVAAHLEPEILVVDEVLAVGDAAFQKKCLGKMGEVAKGGRTVLFVSHNMGAVQTLCTSVVYLQSGSVVGRGPTAEIVTEYLRGSEAWTKQAMEAVLVGRGLRLRKLEFFPRMFPSGGRTTAQITFWADSQTTIESVCILIYSLMDTRVAILDLRSGTGPHKLSEGTGIQIEVDISKVPLVEGEYKIGLHIHTGDAFGDFLDLTTIEVGPPQKPNEVAPYPAAHRGYAEIDFAVPRFDTVLSIHE